MSASNNKPFVFFFLAIILVSLFMFAKEWQRRRIPRMVVPDNRGIAELFTLQEQLAAVFQDGRVCVWDWGVHEVKKADFMASGNRAIPLSQDRLAAAGSLGDRRLLSIYDITAQTKVKDLTVGWEDQDIHLRNSLDRQAPVVIRRNAERNGAVEYEVAAINLDADLVRPPVLITLDVQTQTLRDFAVSTTGVVYAAGVDGKRARLLALDLNVGRIRWDQTWPDAGELTSVAVSMDGQTVWAGDREGNLLTVAAEDGKRRGKVSLLEPGETRTVTNDFSVLNLVPSSDGRLLGCTIAPVAYAVEAATGQVLQRFGGHKVVSKVAFSPDSRRMATADLRADGVISIRSLEPPQ